MSKKRLVSSLAAMSCVLAVAARFVVIQFPMLAPAQPTVLKSGGTLLHRAPVEYPAAAIEKGIAGTVVVQATVNDKGAVEDARVLSGPEALRRAALKSVLDWHYEDQRNSSVEVAIDFILPRNDDKAAEPKAGGKLQRIEFAGVPRAMQNAVLARNTLREGQAIDAAAEKSFENLVREIDEHLTVSVRAGSDGTVFRISYAAPVAFAASDTTTKRLRIGGNVQAEKIEHKVMPAYPPLAKQARMQGKVRMNALIGKDGAVQDLQVVSGEPLLAEAARTAVWQWTYRPTLLNGDPVEVVTVIDVNFTLKN